MKKNSCILLKELPSARVNHHRKHRVCNNDYPAAATIIILRLRNRRLLFNTAARNKYIKYFTHRYNKRYL